MDRCNALLDLLVLLIAVLLLSMLASLPSATAIYNSSTSDPYSHPSLYDDHQSLYDHILAHHSGSERMVKEDEVILSSMDAREKRDLDALLAFRKAVTSDPYGWLSNWTANNAKNMCSSWFGVSCRQQTRRVVAIELSARSLVGTISPSLGNLSLLRTFNLSNNWFVGTTPPEFGHLKALRVLDLSYNIINGSIPRELGLLKKLHILNIYFNALTGIIPVMFGQFKALRILGLCGNVLSGPILVELRLMHKIEYLYMGSR